MIRSLILIGFTYLLFHLHLSGDINKYINMKYSYLSAAAGYGLLVLTIVQILMLNKEQSKDLDCDHEHCGHNHAKEDKWYKKLFIYPIFAFPIISGLFFPIATLDSNIVKAKGFHFPIYDEGKGDSFMQQQFLRPDTSVYYGKDDYDALMKKEKKKYVQQKTIILNDKNYLKGMETIYNFPGDFLDKDFEFKGFVFNDAETIDKNQLFVFRFGVIHCIADSGVFGMLVDMPEGIKLKNDEWITVKGKISTIYYQPFKTNIPYLKVEKWTKTTAPKEQYVYRGY
ncbi:Putative two-component membrane permease complex subunit SMU_746c [Neobacillus rhizosphaerae]|uniref:Two-component membrane permease complex subunit SMU_746c n=1 Tax=Neobacillus rhizosphaerae TaxID=2880965 RepID=A0ABM9ENF4_9BACI|nr:TIGR03943 family protein [Neobacillus rhizosphaerae]CAH2713615.1 Putative two-component membrane permease complex subunit SMU_746c [Neobacillus rhizosphaerae]